VINCVLWCLAVGDGLVKIPTRTISFSSGMSVEVSRESSGRWLEENYDLPGISEFDDTIGYFVPDDVVDLSDAEVYRALCAIDDQIPVVYGTLANVDWLEIQDAINSNPSEGF
jgi:hypothetical protein